MLFFWPLLGLKFSNFTGFFNVYTYIFRVKELLIQNEELLVDCKQLN